MNKQILFFSILIITVSLPHHVAQATPSKHTSYEQNMAGKQVSLRNDLKYRAQSPQIPNNNNNNANLANNEGSSFLSSALCCACIILNVFSALKR